MKVKPKILTKAATDTLRREVAVRDNSLCILCGQPAVDIAHIVPRSHGKKNSVTIWQLKNLACSCRACHIETRAQRIRFLKRMQELYAFDYSMQPFAQYLIEEG